MIDKVSHAHSEDRRPHVIVVEDDAQIVRFVSDVLSRERFSSASARTAREGLDTVANGGKPDLVILDLGLPDMSGIDFIRDLRTWSSVPILILSARSTEQDKISALDAGADDYLTKPFGVGELLARVRALIRRNSLGSEIKPNHCFGEIEVNLSRRIVKRCGEEVHLTQLEYRLLTVLLANADKVITHRHLMREVWGAGHTEQGHYLRIYVGRLRQKLEIDPAQPRHFLTETGVGYRFQP